MDLNGLKDYLDIPATEEAQDPKLQMIVNGVNAAADGMTGRRLGQATYVDEVYDGTGSDVLFLREWPLISVSAVKWGWTNPQTLVASAYRFGPGSMLHRIDGGLFDNERAWWLISYVAGYDKFTGSDLYLKMQEAGAFIYQIKDHKRIGMLSKSLGAQVTEAYAQNLPDHVRDVILSYKKPII
ncbi:MAG: hypothetical protein L0Y74_08110 [candidate division Zixibacteria bacterium]|nr:hypothetical protein [candidate division Zixibacteria bacterium]